MVMEKEKLVSLVTAAQNGDNDAMNELFNAFYNDFYYFALKTVKDDELALDITQEAFVEIINTFGNLKEPAAFVTWAKQITYHQCTRYFKKKKDVLVDEDEDGNTIFDTLKEEKAEFIPDEALDKADFKQTILAILDELSEEQRSATMMYYFDEMSVKQIAEIQGVSEGTVKSRLNYARKSIKNSVEEYEKKHNIKLHAIPFFPFFKWIFEGTFDGGMPVASAELVAEGVTTATGTAITVSATTGTTAAVATTTTATAVGIGAKIAAMPLVTKIIAGVVSAAIVIGGTTTAALLSNDNKEEDIPAGSQSIVSSSDDGASTNSNSLDYSDVSKYFKNLTAESALNLYSEWLGKFEVPYFSSADKIYVDDAVRYGYSYLQNDDNNNIVKNTTVGYQRELLKSIFGCEFDFSLLTGKYTKEVVPEDAIDGEVYLELNIPSQDTSMGINNKLVPVTDNKDGTYSLIFVHGNYVKEKPTHTNEYIQEGDGYRLLDHAALLTVEQKNGCWVIKSYEEKPLREWMDSVASYSYPPLGPTNSSTDSTTDTSSTESTEEPVIIELTKDSIFNGLTNVYTNNDTSSDYYGLLCKNSITVSFCPNGGTPYEDETTTVSTPIVFLGSTYPLVYVPQDVAASPKYQYGKDMLMEWIARGDYNGIPTSTTWEELFTNEAYFKIMDGITHNGDKYILFSDSVGSPGDCYDYTMSDDGSITLIKNSSYAMYGCNYTLTNIKLDKDMKTLTATVNLDNGFSQSLTLKLN